MSDNDDVSNGQHELESEISSQQEMNGVLEKESKVLDFVNWGNQHFESWRYCCTKYKNKAWNEISTIGNYVALFNTICLFLIIIYGCYGDCDLFWVILEGAVIISIVVAALSALYYVQKCSDTFKSGFICGVIVTVVAYYAHKCLYGDSAIANPIEKFECDCNSNNPDNVYQQNPSSISDYIWTKIMLHEYKDEIFEIRKEQFFNQFLSKKQR